MHVRKTCLSKLNTQTEFVSATIKKSVDQPITEEALASLPSNFEKGKRNTQSVATLKAKEVK